METRVVAASCYSLCQITAGGFARNVGTGFFSDEVMLIAVRSESRMNFTIISDSINTFARLCSTAKGSELVLNIAIAEPTGNKGFTLAVKITVKGRRELLCEKR